MGVFKKLFGRTSRLPQTSAQVPAGNTAAPNRDAQPSRSAGDPAKDPNMIRVLDGYGRELFISRQNWLDSVLKGNLDNAWNEPDRLATLLVQLLHDSFFDEAVRPAERLRELEPDAERSATLLGIAYLKTHRLEEAERTLSAYLQRHGESGVVLSNLAKVFSERGENTRSIETLWRGLQVDPNQENAVLWYAVIHREQGGESAEQEALRRISAIQGSWRAQLWLARAALNEGNLREARRLYNESLERAGKPIPADLLMQISGDLGNNGHLAEIVELTAPNFSVQLHGLEVGNNLIKAYLELGQLDQARAVISELYAQHRPEWRPTLGFWEAEIAKRQTSALPGDTKLSVSMLTLDGPVWLNDDSPASALFPPQPSDTNHICFVGSSAELEPRTAEIRLGPTDSPGRLSRALPLFLAEQAFFHLRLRVGTLVPWIIGPAQSGFVLAGSPWADADAAKYAQQSSPSAQIVVITHIVATGDPWQITARVVRCADATCLSELRTSCPRERPGEELRLLAAEISSAVAKNERVVMQPSPTHYVVPDGPFFSDYLLRLEQLLATWCSRMEGVNRNFLTSEREIVGGNLRLCVAQPSNTTVRLLLARTLLLMKQVAPEAVAEYHDGVELLRRQHPLAEPANSIVDRMIAEAFEK
jgi:tetratricopeptide (TPR) repeat protein